MRSSTECEALVAGMHIHISSVTTIAPLYSRKPGYAVEERKIPTFTEVLSHGFHGCLNDALISNPAL